jgi:phosphonate transport system substrate-binding protein
MKHLKIRFLFCILLVLTVVGCDLKQSYKLVNFEETVDTPKPSRMGGSKEKLRVAVAAMISPKETIVYYRELLQFIGTQLDVDIELVQRKTYAEINELFPKKQIDLAFICSGPYALSKNKYEFEAVATPLIRGKPYYQAYLIVNKDSSYQNIDDLRDHVFAFTDPDSNTGKLVPTYWLSQMNEIPESFFSSVTYTFSHDNSIMAVAKSMVDAASVDGHKWEYYQHYNDVFTGKTRIIKKSRLFGSPPFVASIHLSAEMKSKIRDVLVVMHQDPAGKKILDHLLIDRFVEPDEDWYQPVRELFQKSQNVAKQSHENKKS